jgi:predicted transcriptional regulator
MRALINLPDDDVRALDSLSEKLRTSRAALVREAVSEFLERNRTVNLEEAFGLWGETPTDGLEYQRALRDEWSE